MHVAHEWPGSRKSTNGGLFVARNDHKSTLHVGLSSSDDDGEHVVQLVLKNRRHRNRHVCHRLPEQVQTSVFFKTYIGCKVVQKVYVLNFRDF